MKSIVKSIITVAMAAALSAPAFAKTSPIVVGDSAKLAVSGFIQADYVSSEGANASKSSCGRAIATGIGDWAVGNDDTFGINRLQLTAVAQPNDKITAKATLEYGDNMTNTLQDAYVDLAYVNNMTIRVGQFVLPIGGELEKDPYSAAFVNVSQLTTALAQRNRGAEIYGNLMDNVSYNLGFANSPDGGRLTSGPNEGQTDSKQFFGRLGIEPAKDLSLSLYGDFYKRSAGVATTKIDTLGLDISYAIAGFGLEGSFASSKLTTTAVKNDKITDFLGAVTYKIPETDVQLVGRYEQKKYTNKLPAAASQKDKIFTLGVNWDFDKNARLQLQREFWSSDLKNANDNDLTVLQLGVKF